MEITAMNSTTLLELIDKAKNETKSGLCDLFVAKLERLANEIRINVLTTTEAAELIEQEAEKMINELRECI